MKQRMINNIPDGRATEQMARQNARRKSSKKDKPRRRRRRRGNFFLHYMLILVVLITVVVVLSLTVFFKIENITVQYPQVTTQDNTDDTTEDDDSLISQSEVHYSEEDIKAELGIALQDNLFLADLERARQNLINEFSYINDVKLTREYPPEIIVEVSYANPIAGFGDYAQGYTLISREGRILEMGADLPAGVIPIVGWQPPSELETGDYLQDLPEEPTDTQLQQAETSKEIMLMASYIVDGMAQTGLTAQQVDLSDRYNIVFHYSPDITVEFGSEGDLVHKMEFVKEIIDTQLEENFVGTIYAEQSGRVWVDPQDAPPIDYGIPEHYVFDELTGTYVDPATLTPSSSSSDEQVQTSDDEQDEQSDSE